MQLILVVILGFILASAPASGAALGTTISSNAPSAILTDHETGSVLFEKAADAPHPPASLAKLMTAALVFEEIRAGRLGLDRTFTVSARAWREGGGGSGGTTMFLPAGAEVSVGDLLRGVIVQSGNDAAIVLAEGIAGSVEAFVRMMNRRAADIGLGNSRFINPHGLPDPEQVVTARDLAKLASHLARQYPDLYAMFGEREFTYNKVRQHNRNRLLASMAGADGLKTGWTRASGYGLVGSASRENRRLVVVVLGLKSARSRDREAKRLLEWGFREFEPATVFNEGDTIGAARVFGGATSRVPLKVHRRVRVMLRKGQRLPEMRAEIRYRGPVEAPVAKGKRIGTLRITARRDGRLLNEADLLAGRDVPQGSTLGRAWDAVADLVLRHIW
jgi:serine-type D-Ala-D-Ala carboxypeptidase (penicillin-binding protein 5/6)